MLAVVLLQLERCELEMRALPTSALALENAVFLQQQDNVLAWPLLCDPTARVVDWVRLYLRHKNVVVVRYSVKTELLAGSRYPAECRFTTWH